MELKFEIPIISVIPDSLCCILDSKAKDLGFHQQKFARLWIEKKEKIIWIQETGPIRGFSGTSGLVIILVATVGERLDN